MKGETKIKLGVGGCVLFIVTLLAALILLFATTYKTNTDFGECVGLGQQKVDSLVYEPNVGNILIGVVGFETLIIPAYIALTSLECPVGTKLGLMTIGE